MAFFCPGCNAMSWSITPLLTGFPRPDGHLCNCHHRWIPVEVLSPPCQGLSLSLFLAFPLSEHPYSSPRCRAAVRGRCFEHETHQHLSSWIPAAPVIFFFAEGGMIILAQKQTTQKDPGPLFTDQSKYVREIPGQSDTWGQGANIRMAGFRCC